MSYRVLTWRTVDWPTSVYIDYLKDGTVAISEGQRCAGFNAVWDAQRKSKYIESLMLGYLTPAILLISDLSNPWGFDILDGNNRSIALLEFATDELPLAGVEVLTEFEGRVFSEIKEESFRLINGFMRRNIPAQSVPLEEITLEDIKRMFYRLNFSGMAQSQEDIVRLSQYYEAFFAERYKGSNKEHFDGA